MQEHGRGDDIERAIRKMGVGAGFHGEDICAEELCLEGVPVMEEVVAEFYRIGEDVCAV